MFNKTFTYLLFLLTYLLTVLKSSLDLCDELKEVKSLTTHLQENNNENETSMLEKFSNDMNFNFDF